RAPSAGDQKHLGRADHPPAAGMVLPAPELLVPQRVQALDELEVTAELEHRVLADRMVGGEEGAEVQTGHERISWLMMMGDGATPAAPLSCPPTLPSLDEPRPPRARPAGHATMTAPAASPTAGRPPPAV